MRVADILCYKVCRKLEICLLVYAPMPLSNMTLNALGTLLEQTLCAVVKANNEFIDKI